MKNGTSAAASPQPPSQESLEGESIRIDLERVAGRLHIRLRPASIPAGLSAGPRVCIELAPNDADQLGHALQRHAAAMLGVPYAP